MLRGSITSPDYGYEKKTTPHIDEIARGGAIFLNSIAGGLDTALSRLSLHRQVRIGTRR